MSHFDDWWEVAKRIYMEDGYLVIGSHVERPMGFCFQDDIFICDQSHNLPQPFQVIAKSTFEEFKAQSERAGYRVVGGFDAFYYRTVTE